LGESVAIALANSLCFPTVTPSLERRLLRRIG
jgi:hypothetical protein